MGVINSPLVEGGVFSEEVNKKEVTVNGVNSNKKSVRITIILHTLFAIISLLLYIVSYTVLCDLKITFLYFRRLSEESVLLHHRKLLLRYLR